MNKLITVFVIIIVIGGLGYLGTQSHEKFSHHGLMDEIHHLENTSADQEQSNFDTTEFLKVHAQHLSIPPFYIPDRAEKMISYPCQNCHSVPLAQLKSDQSSSTQKAHWDIEIIHADASIMTCATCHDENNMNRLTSLNNEPISFDRSFELCGQCHSTQYVDWQGGAHGKSLGGWRAPRLIETCVGCHNPHEPAIQSRWPSRLVTAEKNSTH